MIAEKSQTARQLIDRISSGAPKVSYVSDSVVTRSLMYLERNGLPNHKVEDYKYCNLDAIIKREFREPRQKFLPASGLSGLKLPDAVTIVIENGRYSPELSDKILLNGLTVTSISQIPEGSVGRLADVESDSFIAINTLFSQDGLYLHVAKDRELNMPLQILYISNSDGEAVLNSRNLIVLEENASATIVEHFVCKQGKLLHNFLSEKQLHKGASLRCTTLQDEGREVYSVQTNQVEVPAGGLYENTTITFSGAVVRNNHNVVLSGPKGVAHLNGLFTLRDQQLVDNHTLMDHRVPDCESNELYKGIVSDKSTGIFNGKIFVRKDAQKTNAYQSSKNILLSDDATINAKPQLEIYADDVKCSHGTSTGSIDENAMFYLNARGVGKESAKKMLLASFAHEVAEKIGIQSLRDRIMTQLETTI